MISNMLNIPTLGTITRGHGIGSVLSSAELSTAIPLHTQKASILVKSQARIFAPPAPPPPLSDQFCKKSEKFRIDSEWPETARNRKKNFAPWWPTMKKTWKNFQNFFWKYFESCSESSETSRKLKISKKFFFQLWPKKLRKIFKKKIFQKFFESCSESSETWKKLKKKNFTFFPLPISDLTVTELGPNGNWSRT